MDFQNFDPNLQNDSSQDTRTTFSPTTPKPLPKATSTTSRTLAINTQDTTTASKALHTIHRTHIINGKINIIPQRQTPTSLRADQPLQNHQTAPL